MPKPQYIDCRLLDFVAELVTADENAANLSRIKLLESLAETWLLKQSHFQIEVMSNLDNVPATGAVIVVSWPKVENGLGFPARAFAILP